MRIRVRPTPSPVDRIDDNGNILQHWSRDGKRTVCGLPIHNQQRVSGNRECKRCSKILFPRSAR